MSTIGFPVETVQDFTHLAQEAARRGERLEAFDGACYRLWSVGGGIELWAQVNPKGETIGLNPHFSGQARMPIRLMKRVKRPRNNPLDGAFEGHAKCPIVFDSPDYGVHVSLALPKDGIVQLVAFAVTLQAFENETEMRSTEGWMKSRAVESMIPSGTFTPQRRLVVPPNSEIIFCGSVLDTARIVNPFTNKQFLWAKTRTFGGELDLLADPLIVKGTIKRNGIIGSSCWLSGRIIG